MQYIPIIPALLWGRNKRIMSSVLDQPGLCIRPCLIKTEKETKEKKIKRTNKKKAYV